jgi:hypothetical protein
MSSVGSLTILKAADEKLSRTSILLTEMEGQKLVCGSSGRRDLRKHMRYSINPIMKQNPSMNHLTH